MAATSATFPGWPRRHKRGMEVTDDRVVTDGGHNGHVEGSYAWNPSARRWPRPGPRSWHRCSTATRAGPRVPIGPGCGPMGGMGRRPPVHGRPGRALHQQFGGTGPAHGQAADEGLGLYPHAGRSRALRPHAGPGEDRPQAGMEPPRPVATGSGHRSAAAEPHAHSWQGLTLNTVSVLEVKLWKVPMTIPPVATKVSLGGPPHSGAGGVCPRPSPARPTSTDRRTAGIRGIRTVAIQGSRSSFPIRV